MIMSSLECACATFHKWQLLLKSCPLIDQLTIDGDDRRYNGWTCVCRLLDAALAIMCGKYARFAVEFHAISCGTGRHLFSER